MTTMISLKFSHTQRALNAYGLLKTVVVANGAQPKFTYAEENGRDNLN